MVEELHPTPALGGTPRLEAMKLIRDVELLDRGLYGAPIGWIDDEGNGEFAVAPARIIKRRESILICRLWYCN